MREYQQVKERTISGLIWSFIDLLASQGIQFIVLLILARILAPEHFGLIGMVAIVIAVSNSIIDSGFSQALIREKEVARAEYSTIFYFNILMSSLLYTALYVAAPYISAFFNESQLMIMIRFLSFGIVINSFAIIPRVLLIKKLQFRTQSLITMISSTLAGIISVYLAAMGYGVWSLVVQALMTQALQTIILWTVTKWMPARAFEMSFFRRLFRFGSKLLLSGLIDTFYQNIYSLLIGRLYPAAMLGYYTNAAKLTDVIANSTTAALQRVTYPVLSGFQDDTLQLRNMYERLIRLAAYIMFPLMIGLLTVADSFIPLLLGEQWIHSIGYFKLLCLAAMIYPLHALNLNILQVKGRADLFLKLEIIKKSLLTLLIGASLLFSLGIYGLITAAVLCSYLSLFINTYYSAREISYSVQEQLKDLIPSFFLALLMGGFVLLVGMLLPELYFIRILVQGLSGVIFYFTMSRILKLFEFEILYSELMRIFNGRKEKLMKAKGA